MLWKFPWQDWGAQRPEFPWIDPRGKKRPDQPPKLWELILCLAIIGLAAWYLVMLFTVRRA